MNQFLNTNSFHFRKILNLYNTRKTNTFSNSPTAKKILKLRKDNIKNHQFEQSLTTLNPRKYFHVMDSPNGNKEIKAKNIKNIKENINLSEELENEKIKMKKVLSDLSSWNEKININEYYSRNKIFDLKKFKIPRLKQNKIISSELIPLIKFSENAKTQPSEFLKNQKRLELIKTKFSAFDKDFDMDKFEEEKKLKKVDILKSTKIMEFAKDKRLKKVKLQNELKYRDSLFILHKKLTMNKLKKKKYMELLDETYHLLEKAKTETNTSIDILNERIKSIQKYYAVFINLFKGKSIKLLEEKLMLRNKILFGSDEKEKEKEKGHEESDESEENSDDKQKNVKIKSENKKIIKTKYKFGYEEKIKMYREYISIHEDIVNEIKNYEIKFDNIKKELDIIITNIKEKLEEINKNSNEIKSIQNQLSQKLIKYYLKKLKKGEDIRFEGLSWILIRLFELNIPIDSSLFPNFLDKDEINYLIQIAKYGYEINQLKLILDALREKETGKANVNLKIFSSLTEEGKLSAIFFNKIEENKFEKIYLNSDSNTDKILLKLIKNNPLLNNNSNTISNEHKKFEIENNIVDLKSRELKRRISMFAIDKQYKLNNKKKNFNNEINNLILLSSDRKSTYLYDIIKIIEKINNLNNLVNERREKELINFSEKYKLKNLSDEDSKNHYNKVFSALFGSPAFQFNEK